MKIISNEELEQVLDFASLIEGLRQAFREKYTVPLRHHHHFENPEEGLDSTLLLMPAWQAGSYLGVKIVTVSPNNSKQHLPSIQGLYTLFDARSGSPIAQMDAKILTSRRTAAASALASVFLSRKDSKSMLMVGTGALAPNLIEAHAAVRPIEKVFIWGRNFEKAEALANKLGHLDMEIRAIEKIEEAMKDADIISCATLSTQALVFGKLLKPGQHLDLVGSFKPDMREADDACVAKSSVFVDILEGATKESGDIYLPLKSGVLKREEIKAELADLCLGKHAGRLNDNEITLFKSVGFASEDLAAAKLAFERLV